MGYKNLIIEGDNQVIIKATSGTLSILWQISNIIRDIRYWLDQSNHVEVSHIFREANMAADWLSKYGHTNQITAEAISSLHRKLQKIVCGDVTGRAFVRKGA